MTTLQLEKLNIPPKPVNFLGSVPEWIVLVTLERLGKREGIDFTYQSPLLGGRLQKGGSVIDFEFIIPPDLAINVQGAFYHHESGTPIQQDDIQTRTTLLGFGVRLIFIDENHVLEEPTFYVREALAYRDHSRLGAGGR